MLKMDKRLIQKGMVHVYTGNGKGKTTAALGLALRALGWGARVCDIQFLKGYPEIGEAKIVENFPDRFVLKQFVQDASRSIDEAKVLERVRATNEAMDYAEKIVSGGEFDVVILDEINNALHYGLVDEARVLKMIESKPVHVELILTGRGAPSRIIDAADYVTEMVLVKHPFQKGIKARRGIDY